MAAANTEAETPDDFLTVSNENISCPEHQFHLSLSSLKFLELCTQPKTDEEKDSIVLDFENKLKDISEDDVFDVLCLYALYYVYERSSVSVSAVSRSLFAWYKMNYLMSTGYENRNSMIDPNNDSFLADLGQFTDFYTTSECSEVLVMATLESFMYGNLGLARFLLKFGLIDFEWNERSLIILTLVLKKFQKNIEVTITTDLEELVWRIKQSKLTYRRSVLTFLTIVLVAEYKMFDWMATEFGGDVIYEELKWESIQKLKCLDLLITDTTETKITFRDIEYFIVTILNPFRKPEFRMCDFLETFRKMSSGVNANYNPRSLKDLVRCKIRACLQSQLMLPEQVKKLTVPYPLKEFLLFHCEGMWDLLEQRHFIYI